MNSTNNEKRSCKKNTIWLGAVLSLCFVVYYCFLIYRGDIRNQRIDGLSYFINGISMLNDRLEISSWQEIEYDKVPYLQLSDTYPHQLYSLLRVFLYKITGSFSKSAFLLLLPFLYLGATSLYLTARRFFSVFTSIVLIACILLNYRIVKILTDCNTDAIALCSFLILLYLSIAHYKKAYFVGGLLGFVALFRLQLLSFVWVFPLLMHQEGDSFKTYVQRLLTVGACAGFFILSFNFMLQQYLNHPPEIPAKQSWEFYRFIVFPAISRLDGGNFLLNLTKAVVDIFQPFYGVAVCAVLILLSMVRHNVRKRDGSPFHLWCFSVAILGICVMPSGTWSFLPGEFDVRYVAYAIPPLFLVIFFLVNKYCLPNVRLACFATLLIFTFWNVYKTHPSLRSFNDRVFGVDNWLHDTDVKKAVNESFSPNSTIMAPWARSYLFVPARHVVSPPPLEKFLKGQHNHLIDGLFIVKINESLEGYYARDMSEITDHRGNVFRRILYKPEGTFPTVIFKRVSKI